MSRLRRWLIILAATILSLGLLYVVFALLFTEFVVDLWWFQSLGYGFYFWQRLLYRYVVLVGFSLLFFLIIFANFWGARQFVGRAPVAETEPASGLRRGYRRLVEYFCRQSLTFCLLFSLLVAVFVAFPLFLHWEEALLYVFAPAAGLQDPFFGRDVSYYLFSLPIYQLLLQELLLAVAFIFLGVGLLYWRESRLLAGQGLPLPWGAKVHLSLLAGLIFLIGAWFFILHRHQVVYDPANMPLFFGPGFTQMRVIVPLLWLAIALLLAVAVSFIYFLLTRKGLKILWLAVALFLLALGALYSPVLPSLVQKYIVAPNRIVRERSFIARHIEATLAAYDLARVETTTPSAHCPGTSAPPNFRPPCATSRCGKRKSSPRFSGTSSPCAPTMISSPWTWTAIW
ncbi:MAG: UPF0182 family protein [Desulfobaccales bacterium]